MAKNPPTLKSSELPRPEPTMSHDIALDMVHPFGRHKGKTLRDLRDKRPGYLCWLRASHSKYVDPRLMSAIECIFEHDADKLVDAVRKWRKKKLKEVAERNILKRYADEIEQEKLRLNADPGFYKRIENYGGETKVGTPKNSGPKTKGSSDAAAPSSDGEGSGEA